MSATYSAFVGHNLIAHGELEDVARAVKTAWDADQSPLLIFNDDDGRQVELDLRGQIGDVLARIAPRPQPPQRGRPKLGVTAREVTLLPTQWEWLASQPGGASAALRRLVDQARRSGASRRREAQETVHRVLFALAGDLPDFEEVNRAFYAEDWDRMAQLMGAWPMGVRSYAERLVARVQRG